MGNEIVKIGKLEIDYKQYEERMEEAIAGYRNIVVFESEIPEIAKAKANINKVCEELNKERIAIDKKWREPLDAMKKQFDEIISKGKDVSDYLAKELDVYEQNRIAKRKKEIDAKFVNLKEAYPEFPFDQPYIMDAKWLNKGSEKTWELELETKFIRILKDVNLLNDYGAEFRTLAMKVYERTLDITEAIAHAKKVTTEIERAREQDKIREQEKIAQNPIVEASKPVVEIVEAINQAIDGMNAPIDPPMFVIRFSSFDDYVDACELLSKKGIKFQ